MLSAKPGVGCVQLAQRPVDDVRRFKGGAQNAQVGTCAPNACSIAPGIGLALVVAVPVVNTIALFEASSFLMSRLTTAILPVSRN